MAKRNGKVPTVNRESVLSTTPEETEHECSIASLMETRPDVYAKIVGFLEQGMSPGGAAALAQVPLALVRKIRNLLRETAIHAAIRQTGRNLVESCQLMSERLADEADQIPIYQLAGAMAATIDRAQLLLGALTGRIEHKSVPSPEDLQAMFDALPKAKVIGAIRAENKIIKLPPAAAN
jgi:hypothetical protein